MKRFLAIPFSLFIFSCCSQSTQVLEDQTLNVLRDFRDTLFHTQVNSSRDSLLNITNTLIDVSKTLNDIEQLRNLKDYYSTALSYYTAATGVGKEEVIMNFKNDLNLKISHTDGSILQLGNVNSLFQNYNVNVLVYINGNKQINGKYTLFWAQFTGVDQKNIIASSSFNGNSQRFNNPYSLTIRLPGYITFWIKNTTTDSIYKCNPDYLIMNGKNQDVDVNFIPFN